MNRKLAVFFTVFLLAATAAFASPGAIFTTDGGCTGVNVNIFSSKDAVYLDGGPQNDNGGGGMPNGDYYVKVTTPEGTLLGYSTSAIAVVAGGEFSQCYQLSNILVKASDGSPGYDDTTNNGGEYKVWASTDSSFPNNESKTDNFKVQEADEPPPSGTMTIKKFYDADASGSFTTGDTWIEGWKISVVDAPHEWTDSIGYTTASFTDAPGPYTVSEFLPVQQNWRSTTAIQVETSITADQDTLVTFGNLCLGAGGGLTLGFWSNKNGQKLVGADDLALLVSLNLRNANGTNYDPNNYASFRTWILSATATNMAYMLSAQLAAMELNVHNGFVSGSSLIYAPGTGVGNSLGYATVSDVMDQANWLLGNNGYTVSPDADRTIQEAVKNALDRANNNLNFVQAGPCTFSF